MSDNIWNLYNKLESEYKNEDTESVHDDNFKLKEQIDKEIKVINKEDGSAVTDANNISYAILDFCWPNYINKTNFKFKIKFKIFWNSIFVIFNNSIFIYFICYE